MSVVNSSLQCNKILFAPVERDLITIDNLCTEMGLPRNEFEILCEPWSKEVRSIVLGFKGKVINLRDKLDSEIETNANQVLNLCQQLQLDPSLYTPDEVLPDYETLQFLKQQIVLLNEKKKAMEMEEFANVQGEFFSLLKVLKKTKLDEFEEFICNLIPENNNNFPTQEVKSCIEKLKELKERNRETCIKLIPSLRKSLRALRLPVETELLASIQDNDPILFQMDIPLVLQQKLDHYLELRKSQLHGCFENVRKEIRDIWEMCVFSDEFKLSCTAYHSNNDNSEENLATLEEYLFKCRAISSKLIPLDKKINHYKDSWKELDEVEIRLSDPDKFLNRGGRLLKDELHKKKLTNSLLKMETEIIKDIDSLTDSLDFECRPDLISFAEDSQDMWKKYQEKKVSEVTARHKNKIEILNHELRYGSKAVAVNKKHVAGHASKTTDDIKKKPAPLKAHNPSAHKVVAPTHTVYAMDRGESNYNTTCLGSMKSYMSNPAASSTPVDHRIKRFKPDEDC